MHRTNAADGAGPGRQIYRLLDPVPKDARKRIPCKANQKVYCLDLAEPRKITVVPGRQGHVWGREVLFQRIPEDVR